MQDSTSPLTPLAFDNSDSGSALAEEVTGGGALATLSLEGDSEPEFDERIYSSKVVVAEDGQDTSTAAAGKPLAVPKQIVMASPFDDMYALLNRGESEGVFPGGVLCMARGTRVVAHRSVGRLYRQVSPKVTPPMVSADTVYDVASLTAGLVTTTCLMRLVDAGRIAVDERVSRYLDGFGILGKGRITVRHLLTHTSGLPAWHPYFEELLRDNTASRLGILTSRGARDFVVTAITRSQVRSEQGAKYLYSDVGLIVLGALVEALTGLPLDRAFHKWVAAPLGLASSSFIDLSLVRRGVINPCSDTIAPTEECSWRRRVLCGEVHDDNAWAMGGIAGHSGLFSTARDVLAVGVELAASLRGDSDFVSTTVAREFLGGGAKSGSVEVGKLGWDSPSRENGMAESGLSGSAFGYNGFTGCSLWVDPEKDCSIALLSNRISPSRSNKQFAAFRTHLVKEAMKTVS